jgi:hypothetical protein
MIAKIVSGGQTGVDRAALDVALERGLPRGGWCPRGRRAEDGTIPDRYPLRETPSPRYSQRTEWNVRDADATLILSWGAPAGGTLRTVVACRRLGKPHLVIDLATSSPSATGLAIYEWLRAYSGKVLNVAGPRASEAPAAYEAAMSSLREPLERLACADAG